MLNGKKISRTPGREDRRQAVLGTKTMLPLSSIIKELSNS
jgi:hypothetical protein